MAGPFVPSPVGGGGNTFQGGQPDPTTQQIIDTITAGLDGGGDGTGGGGGGRGRGRGGRGSRGGRASVSQLTPKDVLNSFTMKGGDIVSNLNSALVALHLKQQADLQNYQTRQGKQFASSTARGSFETLGNRSTLNDLAQTLYNQFQGIQNTANADWSKANEAWMQNVYAALKSGVPLSQIETGVQGSGAMLAALNPQAAGSQAAIYNPLYGSTLGQGQGGSAGVSPLWNVAAGLGPSVAGTFTNTAGSALGALQGGNRSWTPSGVHTQLAEHFGRSNK